MVMCAVFGCNTSGRTLKKGNLHLHRFPKKKDLAQKWLNVCKRADKVNLRTAYICSAHFNDEDYENLMEYKMTGIRLILKSNAFPTQNLPSTKIISEKTCAQNSARSHRAVKRQKVEDNTHSTVAEKDIAANTLGNDHQKLSSQSGMENLSENQQLRNENQKLRNENQQLRNENQQLRNENQQLKNENRQRNENETLLKNKKCQEELELLKGLFTPMQVKQILNAIQHVN